MARPFGNQGAASPLEDIRPFRSMPGRFVNLREKVAEALSQFEKFSSWRRVTAFALLRPNPPYNVEFC